jgi:hypothetical protein
LLFNDISSPRLPCLACGSRPFCRRPAYVHSSHSLGAPSCCEVRTRLLRARLQLSDMRLRHSRD